MKYRSLEIETHSHTGRIWMNRPDVHNAFDEEMIAELTNAYAELEVDPAVRVIVLGGRGRSFSAGANLNWMKRTTGYTSEESLCDARALAAMLSRIYRCSKPTVARVHGAALGGGTGLASVCDLALASTVALFAMSEVLYGLIPATISPYVVAAIGPRAARRYFLTGERFNAAEAHRLGLVHEVWAPEQLDARIEETVAALLAAGPAAQAEAKKLVRCVAHRVPDDELIDTTAQTIAALRGTPEAKEGISAFLNKRQPAWRKT